MSFTLAHCSDWHATDLEPSSPWALANKRLLGWLSWTVRRRHTHRPEVLEALLDDLRGAAPDHVVVTGDLTNVALENEFERAARWLERLGDPSWVSVVPGNHDAYVRVDAARSWDLWASYLVSDAAPAPAPARAPAWTDYPTLRVRGPVAVVGLCSALPTLPFAATGRLGAAQIERAGRLLAETRERGLCRVILVHHPPSLRHVSVRRSLRDAEGLREVVAREGAELLLHGHVHRRVFDRIDGRDGPVPVVGVPSASDVGEKPDKRARYHLYEIEPGGGGPAEPRFRIRVRTRGYDRAGGGFADEGVEPLDALCAEAVASD